MWCPREALYDFILCFQRSTACCSKPCHVKRLEKQKYSSFLHWYPVKNMSSCIKNDELNLFLRYVLIEEFCCCLEVKRDEHLFFRKCTRATGRSRGKRASSWAWTLSPYSRLKPKETWPVMWVSLKTCVNVYYIWIYKSTYLKKRCRFYAINSLQLL